MAETKKYYESVNIAKGIAVLLVVIGHSLSNVYTTGGHWFSLPAMYGFVLLYTFHMPLFVLLSGFCNYKVIQLEKGKQSAAYIWKRFLKLMVPYFVWGIIYVFLDVLVGNYTWQQFKLSTYLIELLHGDNANYQLWTLYTLFFCTVISVLCCSIGHVKIEILTIFAFALFITRTVINAIPGLPSWWFITIIDCVMLYLVFFFVGILLRKYAVLDRKVSRTVLLSICALVVLVGNAAVGTWLNHTENLDTTWLKTLGAPVGILLVLLVSENLKQPFLKKVLNLLGDNCMNIYIFANICQDAVRLAASKLSAFHVPSQITLAATILVAVTIPVFINKYIVSKSKILSLLLVGNV